MPNPVSNFLKNIFAKKRIIGDDSSLDILLRAEKLLNELINENKVPGIAITVLKNGEKLFQKGIGYTDIDLKTPVDPTKSVFRIASVSKPIAATALAHMVSDGDIDLDTSFYTYVPYYPKKKWDFTIRQLAGHTAGIRAYQGAEYGLNKPYSIKDGIAVFKDDSLLYEPGTDYLYNSFNWVLISLAMQEVSGIPFEDYVNEKVIKPIGMTNTMAENSEDPVERPKPSNFLSQTEQDPEIVKFYSKSRLGFRKAIPVNNYYKLAGGGYLSTSEDIAQFGQALLEGRLFSTSLQREFLTAQTPNGTSTYYGLGWQVSEDQTGRPFYGHVGNGVGGYSNFFIYPNQQMVFSILTNCTHPKIQEELDAIIAIFLENQIT